MMYALTARFSYIDKYSVLIFNDPDPATRAKLARIGVLREDDPSAGRDNESSEFSVKIGPPNARPPDDSVRDYVGLDCNIHVRATKYSFISRANHNAGERMTGYRLTLLAIERAERWQ